MLPFLNLNADDLVALLQDKIQFSSAATLPVVEVVSLGGQLLGHIVLRDGTHKSISLAGEHRLLRNSGLHGQQSHIAHVEFEGRQIRIDSDRLKGLTDPLTLQHDTCQIQPFDRSPKQSCTATFLDDPVLEFFVVFGQLRRDGVVAGPDLHAVRIACILGHVRDIVI